MGNKIFVKIDSLVDEISTFEAFISQNYPDTNVKEISME